MESEKSKWPEGAKREVVLETGRILYLRDPKFSDMRQASQIGTNESGSLDPIVWICEMIQLMTLSLKRANGEDVDITNRAKFFDDILSFDECQQLIQNPEILGLSLKKNPPVVKVL